MDKEYELVDKEITRLLLEQAKKLDKANNIILSRTSITESEFVRIQTNIELMIEIYKII